MRKPHVAVIGAGAFGGWTALYILRGGARVTLVDAWGPGNSRASSGGETRVMRCTYGPNQPYTELAARALRLWTSNERKWKRRLLHRVGVLWMAAGRDDTWESGSLAMLNKANVPYHRLTRRELTKRWPQINFQGIDWGVFEPQSGYLLARSSCQKVVDAFVAEGGEYRQAAAPESELDSGPLQKIELSDGSSLRADRYVFACGPWMSRLFPNTIGANLESTKQDVFFFGPPPGDMCFDEGRLPVWADHHQPFMYGIPGNQGRGFKIADDTRGPNFDPTNGERRISNESLQRAREYIAFRFPAMKDAPLIESRVCQYEQTPDGDFIVDHHPAAEHVWLLGGGSGHGFKHGPALGELVAKLVLKDGRPNKRWALSRFAQKLPY
ncbi:MAG TPA: FAD-dependent oxidoreductase [Terriglobales bacterium]|nr:FAD-dependent oxidoreductase [Terriglobales bacterium]